MADIDGLVGGHYLFYAGSQFQFFIGNSEEGFTLDWEPLIQPIKQDRAGEGHADGQFVGKIVTLTLIQLNWKEAILRFLGATGSFGGLTNLGKFVVQDGLAFPLQARPGAGNANDKYTFWKVFPISKVSMLHSSSVPRRVPLVLEVYPDFTKAADELFFRRET